MKDLDIKLVVFDLDGTLTRVETICEVTARKIGRLDEIKQLEKATTNDEICAGREEMATWYSPYSIPQLCTFLSEINMAPGVHEAMTLLKKNRIKTAIVSITWEFAVEWFANNFGADLYVGTELLSNGQIRHFWPEDKPQWVWSVANHYGFSHDQVAAVGDSFSDIPLLNSVHFGFL